MAIQWFETTRMLRSLTVYDCISKHRIWCATFFPAGIEHAVNQGKKFRTAPYYCKTNLFSQWQSIVFVIVSSIQELNA